MSNTQKKNVPELRFPGFEGEWEEKQLGEISEQSMYGIGASATNFDSKNIYIRITDIDEKSRNLNYKNLTTPDEINDKYKLKRNDILFARTGASTGKSYIHKEEKDNYNYYFAGFLIKFEINQLNSPMFIYQFTLTSKFNNWVKVMSVRSGQPGINSEEYAKLPLVLPSKLEQQKIGEFFSKLDRQIELEEQKLELLQQQKKCYMQKIFSQELRFKDENGEDYPEWENVMLQKVLKDKTEGIKRGPFGGALKKDIFVESGYAVYEQRNAIYDISNFRYYIDENKYNEMISFSVQPNDIIMSCSGTIGRLSLIPQNFTKGIINQALIRFRTNHKIRSEFFLIFMRSNQMQRKILEANPGSAITNLVPVKELKLIPFPLPVKFEQDKISQFILIINRRIEQSEKKIESLKNRKQGFLLKLFV
ncbi:restriction endonuclease subunit S [Staphylococcus aureus]|uniref:restriction endonuclease subunit S n=1 Tax=Staphylococcus aureus TaxID=1280 RepID=UPI00215D3828|nr:restriction endonuclease subunit S [Staphylococcus aureus]UVI84059.1 restriction endonuclease subunit S [Staphylococcus aureus]UVI94405.1 restriction endonuclease subunit S [Staphylococcus aureus]UVJ09818.1 restriction endonuclease subunit S [Staphylococcus aureus]UVJ15051.1 restriction endonuclease subunit S [Staphylococcus aureus]UVJ17557.1 restriction endonuclease subunit S [Staphylococcus aureus]